MKITTNVKQANKVLENYIGAELQIILYSTTFKRLAFRLTIKHIEEVLYVVGIGCKTISGQFHYKNANINIISKKDDCDIIISDKTENFKLITDEGFTLAQGNESEFGDSFENFIRNK